MIPRYLQRDRTIGWMFVLSFTIHLIAIFIFNNTDFFRPTLHESTPYYVDIVSLPAVAPAPAGDAPATAPASRTVQPPASPQKPVMSLPAKQITTKAATSQVSADQERRDQEAREFTERMGRLERSADAKYQADAVASLQKRVIEKKGSGGSNAPGINKGSDYGAYIQSRLKDALSSTIVFRSQKPEAAVHLYIDKNGKLIKYVMTRPSTDKLFNNSVIRTIEKAKADFPPVPSGTNFDKLYVFSPQEVKK